MTMIYFIINAAIYFLLAVWCLFRTTGTAKKLGYDFVNNSGKAEYTAVYIGMELGLSVFFAICTYSAGLTRGGLISLYVFTAD